MQTGKHIGWAACLRAALVALALLTLPGTALGEAPLCVRAPGVAALVDAQGVERVENGRYEDIFPVRDGALYAMGSRGAYRLCDADGNALSEATFAMILDAGDALVFRRGARYGAMDETGRMIVPAAWTQLTCGGDGGFLALDGDPLDDVPDEIVRLSASGRATRTGVTVSRGLSAVSSGRMPFVAADGRYGAVDTLGAIAIEPAFQYIDAFENGLARARGDEGFGVIDVDGNAVVPMEYGWLARSDAMIAADAGDRIDIYSPDGRLRASVEGGATEAALVGERLAVYATDAARLYDASGALLAQRDAGTTFAPGASGQTVAADGSWGEQCQWLIDPDGADASGRFQQLLPLIPGRYAWLRMAGVEYYSEELGRLQRSWDYDGARYGLADGAGNALLPAIYREILPVGEDHLALVGDKTVTLADRDGVPIRTWTPSEGAAPTGEAGA